MSKYIRTKDGIYEPDGESFDKSYFLVKAKGGWNYLSEKEPILREADTIEELCDCFVAVRPQPKGNDYYILHRFGFVKENCLNGNEVVYGGIWTDKGLQFVAKMNEKGELELL